MWYARAFLVASGYAIVLAGIFGITLVVAGPENIGNDDFGARDISALVVAVILLLGVSEFLVFRSLDRLEKFLVRQYKRPPAS